MSLIKGRECLQYEHTLVGNCTTTTSPLYACISKGWAEYHNIVHSSKMHRRLVKTQKRNQKLGRHLPDPAVKKGSDDNPATNRLTQYV